MAGGILMVRGAQGSGSRMDICLSSDIIFKVLYNPVQVPNRAVSVRASGLRNLSLSLAASRLYEALEVCEAVHYRQLPPHSSHARFSPEEA